MSIDPRLSSRIIHLSCTFCCKQQPTSMLVAGPIAFICHPCVGLASQKLAAAPKRFGGIVPVPFGDLRPANENRHSGSRFCSFCGKGPEDFDRLACGTSATICNECLDLCCALMTKPPAAPGD